MDSFILEIEGVRARLRGDGPHAARPLADLARDFAAFRADYDNIADNAGSGAGDAPGDFSIEIEVCDATPVQMPGQKFPMRVFKSSTLKVMGWFNHRVCIYHDDVVAETKSMGGRRKFWIAGKDQNLIREVTYKFLLSALGEELDCKGIHRVHAFGFENGENRGLLLAPSGRGKSALSCLLSIGQRGFDLYSDESPLLKGTELRPFPTRIAISPEAATAFGLSGGDLYLQKSFRSKMLFSFPLERLANCGSVQFIFRGDLAADDIPSIKSCPRIFMIVRLFADIVVGLGLAQMAEWMLRGHALPRLVRISFSRLWTMLNILFRTRRFFIFNLSKDAHANAVCLEQFHNGRQLGNKV